ncbi:WecB/TagA/CpsF family glycosyltransferase [Enterococcus sp. 669A]|uniref:WecB/TagA/CpsF family glycosyltransferase n=1 Tax=Candidatus Enterococcus moelleringii TaxID=2815325 RepID=A0ABS3L722_9ENTE|nr:WecB/TagA/CpsF family glycosyltransferase [Enterococcus sp. 669A]MBO1305421.1 WecB/TagA/CpsF family glycosyltransferase [Enterococcus sp. 669A]
MLKTTNLYLGSMDNFLRELVNNKDKKKYFGMNTDCYLIALRDKTYKTILQSKNAVVYIDGMGIIFGQKILKDSVAEERIATTDMFPKLFEFIDEHKIKGKKIYLLGGKKETVNRVYENFSRQYKYPIIAGYNDGYSFDLDHSEEIIEDINSLGIDYLFVGLGCPLQEKWIERNFEKLNVKNILSCGGLFDYYAGNVKRAPFWMQKCGLEWLYRFFQEPKRLFKRYFLGNTKYALLICKYRWRRKSL